MPDPFNWFNKRFHEYYRKCQLIYNRKTSNNDSVYYLTPIHTKFNIKNIIQDFSKKIKIIFDDINISIFKEKYYYEDNIINARYKDNKNIYSLFLQPTKKIQDILKIIILDITKILEEKYKIYLIPFSYTIYRNTNFNNIPKSWTERIKFCKGNGAWIWHCDHDSPIVFKIFVYLNDVDEKRAPFEILYNKNKNSVVKMVPYGVNLWSWKLVEVNIDNNDELPYFLQDLSKIKKFNVNPNTRVPIETIKELEKMGYEKVKITGKKGSIFSFQNTLIHTANFAEEEYRDVLVIEYMPSLFQINEDNFDKYFKVPKEELYKKFIN